MHKKQDETFKTIGDTQKNSEYEKLLVNKVDTKINFNEGLSDIIHQASWKVNGLLMEKLMETLMSLSKKKILVLNSFYVITS